MAARMNKVSVFEFSDHVRVALQLTYLIDGLEPSAECTLLIRDDCKAFMSQSTKLVGRLRYLNKYLMTVRFFIEAAIMRRKVLVATGPEAASWLVKSIFACILRILKNRISVFVVVRDLKPERGRFLLPGVLYSERSVLAVESDALLRACLAAGYAPDCYIYPTAITHEMMPGLRPDVACSSTGEGMTILLTGSLDSRRRNYDMLFEALAFLKRKGVRIRIVVGGHCMSEGAGGLLMRLKESCEVLVAAELLSDAELDAALISADAIVCLNRPEFYGGIKGSGAIGDTFFAGKSLLIHNDLASPGCADARFYTAFTDSESLAEHLHRAHLDEEYLRIAPSALEQQTMLFSQQIGEWLKL